MGQNSSSLGNMGVAVSPRNKNKPPRPQDPPRIPKTPNYVVPENKVIPSGAGDMENARKLLRPVSQELSKFHPEFADIFQYDPELDFLTGGDRSSLENSNGLIYDKENSMADFSNASSMFSGSMNPMNYTSDLLSMTNGSLPSGKAPILNNQISSRSMDDVLDGKVKESNLKRTHSFQTDGSKQPRILGHKRQASLTNGVPTQQPVIHEDPREHLYNVTRQEPFSNLIPANASLPLKSSFQSDYSLNLTYAQLAEYRRQQKISDLENRTGKKLKELGDEISSTSTVPKSPFDRANLGTRSGTNSVSTGSSETGVSKSKKKKAPAPPPPPPNAEPPADYDMEDVSMSRNLVRRNSSASRDLRRPAPDPLNKRMSVPVLSTLQKNLMASKASSVASSLNSLSPQTPPAPTPPPPPPPPPLPTQLPSQVPVNINNNIKNNKPSEPVSNIPKIPGSVSLKESLIGAKAQLEMLRKMEAMLQEPKPDNTTKNNETGEAASSNSVENVPDSDDIASDLNNNPSGNSDKESSVGATELGNNEKEEINITTTNPTPGTETKSSPKQQFKKMSSLLQHDIILAAQAQATKTKKKKPPTVLDKPKDAAQMFREELQKAALAREARRQESFDLTEQAKETKTNNEASVSAPGQTRQRNINKSQSETNTENSNMISKDHGIEESVSLNSEISENLQHLSKELPSDSQSTDSSQPSSAQCEQMSISSNNSNRMYLSTWTPEDDLAPDDDIIQEGTPHRDNHSVESEGFKSSMIPMKIKDLKGGKGKKMNKNKYEKRRDSAGLPEDKSKFGSIRRFKKSVHESVKNAFGSISKASGKMLKKHRSQDFLNTTAPELSVAPPIDLDLDHSGNWELASEGDTSSMKRNSMRRSRSEDLLDQPYLNGDTDHNSSDEDESDYDVGDIDFASGMNDMEEKPDQENMTGDKERSPLRQMKRAGVAYVSGTGQIIVLPEYNTVKVDEKGNVVEDNKDDEGRAPKIFKKKDKKLKYESTVRQQERHRKEEILSREIREKETKIEIERRRQQDIERDFRRLRDLDAQEKLEKMQTDRILQQLTFLQQQQVRQAHADLNSNSSLSNAPPPSTAPFMTSGHSIHSLPNHHGPLQSNPNIHQHQSFTHLPGSIHGQAHFSNVPTLTNSLLNQTVPQMSTTVNASHYTTHSAPIIGNTQLNANLPNLSPQDLSYLTGYMQMMGIAPPTTQQQWAFLLRSVNINAPGFPGMNTGLHGNVNKSGPDFSQLFGVGKTLESTIGESKSYLGLVHNNINSTNTSVIQPSELSNQNSIVLSKIPVPTQNGANQLVELESNSSDSSTQDSTDSAEHSPTLPIENNNTKSINSNPLEAVSSSSTTNEDRPTLKSESPEKRIDLLTSNNHPTTNGGTLVDSGNKTVQNQNGALEKMPEQTFSPKSHRLPPKVYGPIGFRPVSFKAGAT